MRFLVVLIAAIVLSLPARAKPTGPLTLSIVGTSDLHGHIRALPWLAGYLANLRAVREAGGVIVLDAGDMLQGTLESNLAEGAPVIRVLSGLGYAGVTVGNHEFDFGPVGPAPSPKKTGDDPRGALKARAAEARFPFLVANLVDQTTDALVAWPNFKPSVLIEAAGARVGLVGAATPSTPRTSLAANVAGLSFLPAAPAIAREARKLRRQGADVIIAVVHEGGACSRFDDPNRLDACDARSEIFSLARQLPKGSVDAIVAGHTHQGLAHKVAGIPIIQAYANGRAFGRVDLTLDRKSRKIVGTRLFAPQDLCKEGEGDKCVPFEYEHRPVSMDTDVARLNAMALAESSQASQARLGVEAVRPLTRNRGQETALANLFADLMQAAQPGSDVAILNGGSLRADLPAGPLTYGKLYETLPFDNVFARAHITGRELRQRLRESLGRSSALVCLSGLRVRARCEGGVLSVDLTRASGEPVDDNEKLSLVTTDFLATGGDGLFAGTAIDFRLGSSVREGILDALRARGARLDPADPALFDPNHPRFDLPGAVPIKCAR